jgi:pyridoxine kinase
MDRQKRILAIHDISCFGRCSLTVALPVISAVGIETSVLPTAILSTHTGGFTGYTFKDLTTNLSPVVKHWNTLDIGFDAIYSGYLGSAEQLLIISAIIDDYKKRNPALLVFIDPVMADNGVLYKAFNHQFPLGMKTLCAKADIITPNLTEACLMLNEEYKEPPHSKEYIENILVNLAAIGPKMVVLTGISFDASTLGAACYDKEKGEIKYAMANLIEGYYHGTGDVFASSLLAAVMKGKQLAWATRIAVDFTVQSIIRTKNAETDVRYGVNFEEGIADLITACD